MFLPVDTLELVLVDLCVVCVLGSCSGPGAVLGTQWTLFPGSMPPAVGKVLLQTLGSRSKRLALAAVGCGCSLSDLEIPRCCLLQYLLNGYFVLFY